MGKLPVSPTERFILELLVKETEALSPSQMVERNSGKLSKNTIYVIIGRMVEKGLIESEKEEKKPGQKGRPRLLYYPTGHGRWVLGVCEQLESGFSWEGTPA